MSISYSECVKYLGVVIDFQLNFKSHILTIENKIARSVGILSKLNPFLPKSALLNLYYALIHPHLLCGFPVWGSTFPTYLSTINTLQNEAIRLISGSSYRHHVTPFYSNINILKFSDLFKLEVAKIVSRHYSGNLPSPISNLFISSN